MSSRLCYTVTTWHPSKFSSKLAAQISATTAPTVLMLQLMNASFLLGAYTDFLAGGLFTWRAVFLSSLRGRINLFSLPDGLRHLFRDHNP